MLLSWKHCSCCSKTSKSHLLPIIFVSSVKQWNITVNFSSLSTENLVKIPQSTQKKFILVFLTRERPSWKFGFAPGPRLCCPMLRCWAMLPNMLPYVALCCPMLPNVALCCAVELCCPILHYVAQCCPKLPYVALCCLMLPYVALLRYVALCCAMLPNVA